MLDFRRVVKNRKIQPEAAFCPTKSLGLEWMDSNPRMQIAPENQVLHRVALRTDDIDQTHAELRSQGLQVSPIVNGQRNDPQGNVISWRIFTIDGDFNGLPYPFVLQWGEDDNARLTRLRAQGLDKPHPAGEVTYRAPFLRCRIRRPRVSTGTRCSVLMNCLKVCPQDSSAFSFVRGRPID